MKQPSPGGARRGREVELGQGAAATVTFSSVARLLGNSPGEKGGGKEGSRARLSFRAGTRLSVRPSDRPFGGARGLSAAAGGRGAVSMAGE